MENQAVAADPAVEETQLLENTEEGDEAGLVTAEYAVGIVTAVAFAGLLLAIIRSDSVRQMLLNILEKALGVTF
ncbi:MAG: DUF4244 domain-containing protein [Actinomycetaceae bacterium]|nr:DUF4244 domain-containing protein [Actinomycetaceae bacterium]